MKVGTTTFRHMGSSTMNEEPRPSPALYTRIVPPWRATTRLHMNKPADEREGEGLILILRRYVRIEWESSY